MNKRISTNPHCFISVVGPADCGKTRLIAKMISKQEKIFRPSFVRIIYFYKHNQEAYKKLRFECSTKAVDLDLVQGLEWNAVGRSEALKQRNLVVIDDLYDEAAQSKEFLDLVIAGRHKNVHLMVLRHNLFQQCKNSKTIDLNVTQMILFNSPRDLEQIGILGRQLREQSTLMKTYKRVTQEPFGHLMIDLDARSSRNLRYCSHCSADEPTHFYCATDRLFISVKDEFTKQNYYTLDLYQKFSPTL